VPNGEPLTVVSAPEVAFTESTGIAPEKPSKSATNAKLGL